MQDELQITIRNRLPELARLAAEAVAFLEARQAPGSAVYAASLALEEMVSNTIKYGYADDAEHAISVRLRLNDRRLTLVLEDDGRPFDPTAAPTPDTSRSLDKRTIGGLGIHLTREMTQGMIYQRIGDGNRLEIHIDLLPGGTGQSTKP